MVQRKIDFIAKIISSFFFLGFCPLAPGTAGSLAGLGLYAVLLYLPDFAVIIFMLLITLAGFYFSPRYAKITGQPDPKEVIIDEVAGMLIAFIFIPFKWWLVILGFIFFRVLDILKPFPIRRLEKLPGGIMLDDLAAGAATNILLNVIIILTV